MRDNAADFSAWTELIQETEKSVSSLMSSLSSLHLLRGNKLVLDGNRMYTLCELYVATFCPHFVRCWSSKTLQGHVLTLEILSGLSSYYYSETKSPLNEKLTFSIIYLFGFGSRENAWTRLIISWFLCHLIPSSLKHRGSPAAYNCSVLFFSILYLKKRF